MLAEAGRRSISTRNGMRRRALGSLIVVAGCLLPFGAPQASSAIALDVPVVHQAPEHCGQAAVEMVMRYYGAKDEALHEADQAYNAALRGSLITDLAAAARRAGFDAVIATLTPDSLIALLATGVPPVVLYQNGRAPLTVPHFGVVTGWDPERERFTLNEGGSEPRHMNRNDLARRWRTAGSQALLIRRSTL